jgi:hypothetical protein
MRMTEHHVLAALADAGMDDNEAESFADAFRKIDETPAAWRAALEEERDEALNRAAQLGRAIDALFVRPSAK